jgi:hypothetical protein
MRFIILAFIAAGPAMADPAIDHAWRFFSDQVMGGVSSGQAQVNDHGLRLTGAVSTANNGGFIQARTEVQGFGANTTGIEITVRGDGQPYFIHLRTTGTVLPWQYYQAEFPTSKDWQTIRLPWSAFQPSGRMLRDVPNPDTIRGVALVAFGRDHSADVTLRAFAPY